MQSTNAFGPNLYGFASFSLCSQRFYYVFFAFFSFPHFHSTFFLLKLLHWWRLCKSISFTSRKRAAINAKWECYTVNCAGIFSFHISRSLDFDFIILSFCSVSVPMNFAQKLSQRSWKDRKTSIFHFSFKFFHRWLKLTYFPLSKLIYRSQTVIKLQKFLQVSLLRRSVIRFAFVLNLQFDFPLISKRFKEYVRN